MKFNSMHLYDPRWPDRKWACHSNGMKILFGLNPKQKWPAEGLPARTINGIKIWVNPLQGEKPNHGKRHTHRVRAKCPYCGQEMSAGRINQHRC